MDSSRPGPSVHGIFQAKILEWVAIFFSRQSSLLRDQICIVCMAGGFFPTWAIWEAQKNVYQGVKSLSFLINYFNWRKITLQYCAAFGHTSTWISHGWNLFVVNWEMTLILSFLIKIFPDLESSFAKSRYSFSTSGWVSKEFWILVSSYRKRYFPLRGLHFP